MIKQRGSGNSGWWWVDNHGDGGSVTTVAIDGGGLKLFREMV